ncbi:hypothetical protein Q3H58_001656 [Pseudomonas psychrotolerans]|nr:hypothetical protein [Pseudomonas psychrotolerans]
MASGPVAEVLAEPLALAHVEGDAKALVAIEFDRFHLTLADGGGQPLVDRDGYLAGAGTLAPSLGQDSFDLLAQFG